MMRSTVAAAALVLLALATRAQATLFHTIDPDTSTINANGSLTDNGNNYVAIYKPSTPPPSWVKAAWIDPNLGYTDHSSLGFEIDPTINPSSTGTDKTQIRVSHAGDSSDLEFNNKRYLGFALYIPSATYQAPTSGAVQIAQWWQGSPYGPPIALDLTGQVGNSATYELIVHNDTTLGNPSSVPVTVMTGTIPLDTWQTFTVMTIMNYDDANDNFAQGQIKLWQDGTQLAAWTGANAYDPTTIPYKNPPVGTANPNSAFDVFVGPYRPQQETEQQEFFDDINWADTFADATPPTPPVGVPEPAASALLLLASASLLTRRRHRTI